MKSVFSTLALSLFISTNATAAPVPELKAFQPTLVVRVQPIDTLLGEANFVAGLVARAIPNDAEAKQVVGGIERGLEHMWGPEWRKAIDTTRPSFGYAFINERIEASTGAAVIPVRNEAAFLAMLERFAGKVEKQADGTYRLEIREEHSPTRTPLPCFLRIQDGYAYVTVMDRSVLASDRLPSPAQIMAEEKGALASAHVFIERVPKPYRDAALGGIGSFKGMLKGEHGPNTAGGIMPFFGMWAMMMGFPLIQVYPYLEPVIQDGKDATLHLMFDRAKLDLALDLVVTPRADSGLATKVAAWKPLTSRFASWTGPNAAAAFAARLTIPEDLRTAWADKLEEALKSAPPNPAEQAVAQFAKSFVPTLRGGEIDVAFALHPAAKAPGYTLVAGVQVGNGMTIEGALREMIKNLPKPSVDMCKLDAAKIDGVNVHHITIPAAELGPSKRIFGEAPVRVAFKPDAVLATFGPDADQFLAAALKGQSGPESGFRLNGAARRLMPMIIVFDNEIHRTVAMIIGADLDRFNLIDVRVEGGKTLRIHQNVNSLLFGAAFFGVSTRAAFPAQVPIPPPPAPPRQIKP